MATISARRGIIEKTIMQTIFCLSLIPILFGWFSIDPVIDYASGLRTLMGDIVFVILIIIIEALLWFHNANSFHLSIVILLLVLEMNYFRSLIVYSFWPITSDINLAFISLGTLPGFWISIGTIGLDVLLYVIWSMHKSIHIRRK